MRTEGMCACCGEPLRHAGHAWSIAVPRRVAIGGLAGLPLAAILPTAPLGAMMQAAPGGRPNDWVGASYAREMAGSVTSALVSLVRAYGGIANQIGSLQARQRELADKLAEAVRDKANKLQEFRDGLFCSGCKQTRSEILAKGERFPHDGQTIIKATDEQIAAKERDLQAIIDRLAEDLKKTRAKIAELDPDLTEIQNQIFTGMGLWRTANTFERRLIRQEDVYDAEAYFQNRARITRALAQVQTASAAAKGVNDLSRTVSALEEAIATLRLAEAERGSDIERVEKALSDNITSARNQVASVDRAAKEEASRITAFGMGGFLAIVTVPMNPNIDPNPVVAETAGAGFRMGRYARDSWGEVLPKVVEFIARAARMQMTAARGSPMSAGVEISRAESALDRLKSRLALAEAEAKRAALAEAAAAEKRRLAAIEADKAREELAQQSEPAPAP